MLRSSRKSRPSGPQSLNLTSVMDAIFILLFYFITFLTFDTYKEILTPAPQVNETSPPENKKPLGLNLKINNEGISVFLGVPEVLQRTIPKLDGKYDIENLHNYLLEIKRKNPTEKLCILEPDTEVAYEDLIAIIDASRIIRNTDEAIYMRDEKGNDIKLQMLFSEIVFANL